MADVKNDATTTAVFAEEPTIGSSYSGVYETFGDRDWVRITLTAGVTYKFAASAQGFGSSGDSFLRLYNAAGVEVAFNDDGGVGLNSLISYTPTSSGTYFVDVATFGNVPGVYSITVTGQVAVDKQLTDAADTYTGLANERIFGGKGNDVITMSAAIQAFGEQGDDTITGTAANNFITGGLGSDEINAAAGNDLVYGDGGLDLILGGDGNDKIYGGDDADYLSGGNNDDNLTGGTGADDIYGDSGNDNLSGNTEDDRMSGGSGNDTLVGGTGADDMSGGAGDDRFYVDNLLDVIGEGVGGGNDTVFSSITYTLTAGAEVELLATSSQGGLTAINLTGNNLAQRINGNNGNNSLQGLGGSDTLIGYGGNDMIEGGAGSDNLMGISGVDSFVFRQSQLSTSGTDHILDFGADDFIRFDVTSGPTGILSASAFRPGSSALTSTDRFIYDQGTGNLYFDADGTGASAKVLFAVLDNHFALSASDIMLV